MAVHKIVMNLRTPHRQRLELVRTFLTFTHPEGAFCTFADAVAFLLDTAPIEHMLTLINGAYQPKTENINAGNQNAGNRGDEIAATDGDEPCPPKRRRGRPRK